MNYDMLGMYDPISYFAMFDISKVEIEKEHQVLMVDKTTGFEKGKGKKGNFTISKPVAS